MIFRELTEAEIAEFQQWAIENYKPFEPIEREIWHPVIVAQCDAINAAYFTAAKGA